VLQQWQGLGSNRPIEGLGSNRPIEEHSVRDFNELLVIAADINTSIGRVKLVGTSRKRFMDIIRQDDVEAFRCLYHRLSHGAKQMLPKVIIQNIEFTQGLNTNWKPDFLRMCYLRLPVTLAAMFCARRVFTFFFETYNVVRISQTADVGDNNIIHAIVLGSCLGLKGENVYVDYFREILGGFRDQVQMQRLLRAENIDGLRPLEFAAKLGQFKLMATILNTNDLYRFGIQTSGPVLMATILNTNDVYRFGIQTYGPVFLV
jgi:hypothetical protein